MVHMLLRWGSLPLLLCVAVVLMPSRAGAADDGENVAAALRNLLSSFEGPAQAAGACLDGSSDDCSTPPTGDDLNSAVMRLRSLLSTGSVPPASPTPAPIPTFASSSQPVNATTTQFRTNFADTYEEAAAASKAVNIASGVYAQDRANAEAAAQGKPPVVVNVFAPGFQPNQQDTFALAVLGGALGAEIGPIVAVIESPIAGAIAGPIQAKNQGPVQGAVQGPIQGAIQGAVQGYVQGVVQGVVQGTVQSVVGAVLKTLRATPVGYAIDPATVIQQRIQSTIQLLSQFLTETAAASAVGVGAADTSAAGDVATVGLLGRRLSQTAEGGNSTAVVPDDPLAAVERILGGLGQVIDAWQAAL